MIDPEFFIPPEEPQPSVSDVASVPEQPELISSADITMDGLLRVQQLEAFAGLQAIGRHFSYLEQQFRNFGRNGSWISAHQQANQRIVIGREPITGNGNYHIIVNEDSNPADGERTLLWRHYVVNSLFSQYKFDESAVALFSDAIPDQDTELNGCTYIAYGFDEVDLIGYERGALQPAGLANDARASYYQLRDINQALELLQGLSDGNHYQPNLHGEL